jgi:hypothetical protein
VSVVVREQQLVQFSCSSVVVSFIYCILEMVGGSEFVCSKYDTVCSVLLCCVMEECYIVTGYILSCLYAVK